MKITRIAAVGLISATIAIGGFAGCGSSSSSSSGGSDTTAAADTTATTDTAGGSSADFVAAADKVCSDAEAALKQTSDSADVTTLEGLQTSIQAAADQGKSALADLQAIEPPADVADAYQAFLTAQEAGVTAAEDIATKVAAETDLTTATQVAADGVNAAASTIADVKSTATAAGLTACAGDATGLE